MQAVVVLLLDGVEPAPQVDGLGRQIPVGLRAGAGVRGLDRHLPRAFPQHARDDGAVPIEFVPHRDSFLGGGLVLTRRSAFIRTLGRKNPSRGEGRLARGSVGLSPARAYAISTRLLRPVTAMVDMVQSV